MIFDNIKINPSIELLIIIGVIQGFPILAQLVYSMVLDSSGFGEIRLLESFLSVILLIVLWGAPTMAMRDAALVRHADRIYSIYKNYIYSRL